MNRKRIRLVNHIESSEESESDDEKEVKKVSITRKVLHNNSDSSEESDIEKYLQNPEKLDLDSQFFRIKSKDPTQLEKISGIPEIRKVHYSGEVMEEIRTQKVLRPVQELPQVREFEEGNDCMSLAKATFNQLQKYNSTMEEAKKRIEMFRSKDDYQEKKLDITNLLETGERIDMDIHETKADLYSSDFESCESDKYEFEEVKGTEQNIIPTKNIQVIVNMPGNVTKKKGIDFMAALKRRLNRVRRENQVLVHKVHLLCWIAHGNFLNSVINDTEILATALSLLPSQNCYPADRTDLSYLEEIVSWYKKTIALTEKPIHADQSLSVCLQEQMKSKESHNKKIFTLIFVAILRSLGIQTRIVMSLQVEPLRPLVSELYSSSTTKPGNNTSEATKQRNKVNSGPLTNQRTEGSPSPTHSRIDIAIQGPSSKKQSSVRHNDKKVSICKSDIINRTTPAKNKKKRLDKTETLKVATASINAKALLSNTKSFLDHENKSQQNIYPKKIRPLKSDRADGSKNSDHKKGCYNEEQTLSKIRQKDNKSKETAESITDTGTIRSKSFLISKRPKSQGTESVGLLNAAQKSYSKAPKGLEITDSSHGRRSDRILKRMKLEEKHGIYSRGSSSQSSEIIKSQDSQNSKALEVPRKKIKGDPSVSKRKNSIPINSDTVKNSKRSKRSITQLDGIDDDDSDGDIKTPQAGGVCNTDKSKSKSKKKKMKFKHRKAMTRKALPESDDEYEPPEGFYNRLKEAAPSIQKWKHVNSMKASYATKDGVKEEVINIVKKRIKQEKRFDKRRCRADSDTDSDSDYVPEAIQRKHCDSEDEFVPQTKTKRRVPVHPVLSDDDKWKKTKKGNDIWVEVFLEAEEKWISVDVVFGMVHCVEKICQRATSPISYVLGWDNNNNIKDVTQRYCPNFNTTTRKLRVDPKWWSETLQPFIATPTSKDEQENDDLSRQQLDQPLPKTISEYKNHPLYALKRHLLKFEAIYPPEPAILGYIRGEAVYPRSCVFTLHSRDIWLKQAKVVKLGEQPYKIVKARPKWDKLSNKLISDQELEVFGPWQVQDYNPPTAENGVVPRNAFGNVDLFKPSMLPKGCVHLKLPGLNKICKGLRIDCAAAIVGFDFHGGWSHPVYDGFVVCEEHEIQVVAAWEFEQTIIEKKEQERIDKRVFGNWKKLIKGLLIRERLKAKYDFGELSTTTSNKKKRLK